MTVFSATPLQEALYEKLNGDTALMALVSGIFDHVNENTPYPYIEFGDLSGRTSENLAISGMEHAFILNVWSREGGKKQALAIMERVHTLLHNATMTIVGQNMVFMRFESSRIGLQNDGLTYQGIMQFRALLQVA